MPQTRALEILKRIVPWANGGRENYKGLWGRIGIVGGARDYAGAPYYASISTIKAGADLAYVICSQSAGQVIKTYSPALIVTPLLDYEDEKEFDSEMDCLSKRLHALVIGPGLGREKKMLARAKLLIEKAKQESLPLVLDADSLLLVNDDPNLIRSYHKAVLTPNRIELQRILNSLFAPETFNLRNMQTDELKKLVSRCAKELDVPILAKGSVDICCEPSGFQLLTDELSGSNKRCGGQGDILAGLTGVFLHWILEASKHQDLTLSNPVTWASYLAATVTRRCNELAHKEFKFSMTACNMIDKIYIALETLLEDAKICSKANNFDYSLYTGLMSPDEIGRYRRQMIMEEFGPERQMRLHESSAIIIGAGGLGCPVAVYLGAGGIGRLGIVDDDRVEVSNLHRQILHNLRKVGQLKTESIKDSILAINPNVQVDTHSVKMTRHNAVKLIENYDIVIDATDNLSTRYMINDACVVAKKPLVSGAALKMDGQLTVYNYDEQTPCFRCLFPEPPPAGAVGSCSENGVLGVVPGVIGVQQALEALKIGAGLRPAYAGKMLLFDGQLGLTRLITLSKRKIDCEACGAGAKLGRELINYEEFCQRASCQIGGGSASVTKTNDSTLGENQRISCRQYRMVLDSNQAHVLVDVRPLVQSNVSRFRHALQIPVAVLVQDPRGSHKRIREELEAKGSNQVYVVCRRGIASQRGVQVIQDMFKKDEREHQNFSNKNQVVVVKDLVGGMTAWASDIDPSYACL